MLKSLGITVNPNDGAATQLELAHLPDSPLDLVKNRTNSAQSAYTLLLFGMLTPDHMEHVRECFAAKALPWELKCQYTYSASGFVDAPARANASCVSRVRSPAASAHFRTPDVTCRFDFAACGSVQTSY